MKGKLINYSLFLVFYFISVILILKVKSVDVFETKVIFVPILLTIISAVALLPIFPFIHLKKLIDWKYYFLFFLTSSISVIIWLLVYELGIIQFLKAATKDSTANQWQDFWLIMSHNSESFCLLFILGLLAVTIFSESIEKATNAKSKKLGIGTGGLFAALYILYLFNF